MTDKDNTIEPTIQPNGVATIRFNRPEARNALTLAAMRQFSDTVNQLAADDSVRVVVLTGAGDRAFCSGGDLFDLAKYPTEDDARMFTNLMGDALLALENLPVPVIAAINGYALGGGSEIAVACDIRIADDQARMGFVQINLALTPGWGAGQRLMRLVGYSEAMHMLLRGEIFTAPELLAHKLVKTIVPQGQAYHHALQFADEIATKPPEVIRAIKALLRAGLTQSYNDALHTERELFAPLWAADAHLNAVDAFIKRAEEKRKAKE